MVIPRTGRDLARGMKLSLNCVSRRGSQRCESAAKDEGSSAAHKQKWCSSDGLMTPRVWCDEYEQNAGFE